MAYSRVWTDATPVGTDLAKNAPTDMQHIRVDFRERLQDIFTMPDFTSDPLKVGALNLGYAGATGNAFINMRNYQNTLQWQFGVLQRTSETALTLRNAVTAGDVLSVNATTNLVTFNGGVLVGGAAGFTVNGGPLTIARTSLNAVLTLNSNGGSGRSFSLNSTTSGQFQLKDETAGGVRWFMDSAGNITTVGSYSVGTILYLLGDSAKNISGNATDLTIINDNVTGTVNLRTNGVNRLVVNGAGNVSVTGTFTAATGLTVTAGGITITAGGLTITAGGMTVTGAATFSTSIIAPAGSFASFGTNPATGGSIRLANGALVVWRNAANSANINGLYLDASDNLQTGTDLNVNGVLTATTITGTHTGSGASLTALNASNLASGTIPSARVVGSYSSITAVGSLLGLNVTGDIAATGTITASASLVANGSIVAGTTTITSGQVSIIDNGGKVFISQSGTRTVPHIHCIPMTGNPTSLPDGGMWANASGWFTRVGGVTKQFQLI